MKRYWIYGWMALCMSALVVAEDVPSKPSFWTVKSQKNTHPLYFSGIMGPLNSVIVSSPVEGVVQSMNFVYGSTVKKGQELVRISSQQVKKDYQTALTNYLNAKEKFFSGETQFQGIKKLMKLGIIPQNEYKNAESMLSHANVTYLQALHVLNQVLKEQQQKDVKEITNLKISDVHEVDAALKRKSDERVIIAPKDGLALMPPASQQGGSEVVAVGVPVSAGQGVLSIGSPIGFALTIQVTEVDIGQVSVGQLAHVTGVAFPGIELQGHVTYIDVQASNEGSGLPAFSVRIEVPDVKPAQQKLIKVGMSAKIQIDVEAPNAIAIPIKAVSNDNGKAVVQVMKKDGSLEKREIVPGKTSKNQVVVHKGLKEGERIALPD